MPQNCEVRAFCSQSLFFRNFEDNCNSNTRLCFGHKGMESGRCSAGSILTMLWPNCVGWAELTALGHARVPKTGGMEQIRRQQDGFRSMERPKCTR